MLAREEVINLCTLAQQEDWRWAVRGIRMQHYFVKFGEVSVSEVENQKEALRLIDPNFGRVPRIHDYFSENGTDYLVMDLAEGEHPSYGQDASSFRKIVQLVNHIHSFTRGRPGPTGVQPCSGLLWGQDKDDCFTFASPCELETFINSRMTDGSRVDLSGTQMVFTHGDLAPRNILVSPNGEIWLLDWAFAGYFPRSAEIAALYMQNLSDDFDRKFVNDLAAAIQHERPLMPAEYLQLDCWKHFAFNNLSYYWPTPEEKKAREQYKAAKHAKTVTSKSRFGEISEDHPAYALLNIVG